MAARYANRVNNGVHRRENRDMYVYGSAVRQPAYAPERSPQPLRPVAPARKRRVSQGIKKARMMNRLFVGVLFLCAICIFCLCVEYVRLQSGVTSSAKDIAAMQEELADLKDANNTKYNAVMDSVNLDEVREKAVGDLGMVYASSDQIVTYDSVASDYVEQYEDIPEDGALASEGGK